MNPKHEMIVINL